MSIHITYSQVLSKNKIAHSFTTSFYYSADLAHIVTADGSQKMSILYNGTLPGPPIVVYENQEVDHPAV